MSEPFRPDGMPIRFTSVDRVRYDEDRLREARFWATRTMAERVIAGWELAEDELIRGVKDEPQRGTGITLRPVFSRRCRNIPTMNPSLDESTPFAALERRSPVQEHHIDFLLEEEFAVNPAFLAFFLRKTSTSGGGLPISAPEPDCLAVRSVVTDQGETDVLVVYKSAEFGRVAILIEDKIRAGFEQTQPERYTMRGEAGIRSGEWDDFRTCLVSPERYAANDEGFDARISIETLTSFFSDGDRRAKFKAGVLKRVLHRFEQTGLQRKDESVTRFRTLYAQDAKAFFEVDKIRYPFARDAWTGDTWFNFPLAKGVEIVHKAPVGFVDLAFRNTQQDALAKALNSCVLERNTLAVQTGKSASVRLTINKITEYEHYELARPVVLQAFQEVQWLARFYREHESLLQGLLSAER